MGGMGLGRDLLDLIGTQYGIFKIVIFKILARGQFKASLKTSRIFITDSKGVSI
jgi:hypothetical protein